MTVHSSSNHSSSNHSSSNHGSSNKTPKEMHEHEPLKFPEGFLWGSATSAHQVEGNNKNSDWWAWENEKTDRFRSGDACDQYNRYEEDFDLVKELNHNSHRLSKI